MTLLTRPTAAATVPGGILADRLPYVEDGHPRQCLDLYRPRAARGPLPTVIWLHGGDVLGDPQTSVRAALPLVDQGYAVVRLDYRGGTGPAAVHDAKAAVRWLRAHADAYALDADRIGLWGESTGGGLAALLGTSGDVADLEGDLGHAEHPSRVQAVVDFYGPVTPPPWAGVPSALRYVSAAAPPFMIAHGNRDRHVTPDQSGRLAHALATAGVDVSLHVLPDAGHGDSTFFDGRMHRLVAEFFAEHLGRSG